MNLKEQLYVCTLAETGNITQAAKQLFISQPALSLYISNLENILGIRLFERIGKSFVLTRAGELYVDKAREMLKLKESFDYGLSEIINGQNERLRVGMQDIRSRFITPKVLPQMEDLYPRTKLTWMEGNYSPMEQMLLNNELDIFFCNCNALRKDFEYIPLLNDEVVFIVYKKHPLCSQAQMRQEFELPYINLKLFENERFLLVSESQSLRKYSTRILKACGVFPKNIFLLKNIVVMINLVNINYGVGFSLKGYIDKSANTADLGIFSIMDPPVTATFYAVYKKGRKLTPAAETLIELIKSSLDKHTLLVGNS